MGRRRGREERRAQPEASRSFCGKDGAGQGDRHGVGQFGQSQWALSCGVSPVAWPWPLGQFRQRDGASWVHGQPREAWLREGGFAHHRRALGWALC